mmetsp:Transcript_7117/g.20958  ORF Transcript_7117/g.20958 Transcript_7117/m.20958 type:complete len:243 (+) Transcript_7117:290-1018(+)
MEAAVTSMEDPEVPRSTGSARGGRPGTIEATTVATAPTGTAAAAEGASGTTTGQGTETPTTAWAAVAGASGTTAVVSETSMPGMAMALSMYFRHAELSGTTAAVTASPTWAAPRGAGASGTSEAQVFILQPHRKLLWLLQAEEALALATMPTGPTTLGHRQRCLHQQGPTALGHRQRWLHQQGCLLVSSACQPLTEAGTWAQTRRGAASHRSKSEAARSRSLRASTCASPLPSASSPSPPAL